MPENLRKIDWPKTPVDGWMSPLIGVKWAWRGRDPEQGLDCYGLLIKAYKHFGVAIPDYLDAQTAQTHMGQIKQTAQLIHHNISGWTEVDRPVPGVALLMRFGIFPVHVAVYVGQGDFIHACQTNGEVTRECLEDHKFNILGYFIPPNVPIQKEVSLSEGVAS